MSLYYQTVKIPVKIMMTAKTEIKRRVGLMSPLQRKAFGAILSIVFVLSQVAVFSAFEAHVINVTAHICSYSETRTPGYWKTHEEITTQLLPQNLGCETVTTFEQAFDILDSNAKDMRNKLGSQLLAMKFNIAYYGVGGYVADTCGGGGKTIDQLVSEADALLCDPNSKRKDLEDIKNILDCLNNLHQIRACATPSPLLNIFNTDVEVEISDEIKTNDGEVINLESPENQTEEGTSTSPDTMPPVITLTDSDTINIYVGDSYTDSGATASDDVDGDITAKIVVVNPVDTNVAGTYIITYNVSDAAGNPAIEVIRTVVVSERPASPPPEETPPPETPPETNQTNNNELPPE